LRILYRKAPKSKRKFAKNWATRQDTDIILLKIGTNGYAQSDRTALQTLVNTITFTHPQGVLADDLAASYHWSKDMQTFHDDLTINAAGKLKDSFTSWFRNPPISVNVRNPSRILLSRGNPVTSGSPHRVEGKKKVNRYLGCGIVTRVCLSKAMTAPETR
jgi:hypothetical protein